MNAQHVLTSLGFVKEGIFETVVSTYRPDGRPNAAPMGVMLEDDECLSIRPFKSTLTYRCLMDKMAAALNITSDPLVYYRSVFKDANPGGELPEEWFEKAEVVDAPRLRAAEASVEVDVVRCEDVGGVRAKILCRVRRIYLGGGCHVRAYSRAVHAAMESIIHATRIKFLLSKEERDKADRLVELVYHYDSVVRRVAPHSVYSDIMDGLVSRIEAWRRGFV